jgi:deoxyribodipyrimidine photolyase-like uncharacterized protein
VCIREWFDELRRKLSYWICPDYVDDLEERLSSLLWHVTGGLLSKPNYTTSAMITAADDYQARLCDSCENCIVNYKTKGESACEVCERITEANKDIFWVFARTHQPGTQEEFLRIPYKDVRFCPVCGREIGGERKIEEHERKEDRQK